MYTFKNTERNNKKASEFETKSMLYLLGMRADSNEIETITIDCFNDVTGACNKFEKLWDIQSKNHSTLPPSKIGESLLTLYNNYVSDFDFFEYILFTPKLDRSYLINKEENIYNYNNFTDKTQKGIKSKIIKKLKFPPLSDEEQQLNAFLDKVFFVEDVNTAVEYVKRISRFKKHSSMPVGIYENIFNEIRDRQSVLKNSYIENEIINQPKDVLLFNRHITKLDINTLIINRLVGIDIFSAKGVPIPFIPFLVSHEEEKRKDIIQDCNSNLSRCFFDKNGCKKFWSVSECIVNILRHGERNVDSVFSELIKEVKIRGPYLNELTIKYLISLILSGMNDDN
ncbi:hypothetical protein RC86_04910 [Pectobacterium brasiliense]|uniref:hypothetical protein n=3 Tax=Pectobacterium TaxID=122277 RepID=UPI00057CE3D9|nr:hypothetical protein [Pectobacterium brasiliense]KHS93461.1 hypothetical protein RC86_04910 [Pectobacterium brasiliense]